MNENVKKLIQAERDHQDAKWGADRNQHPFLWLAILGEEVGETNEAVLKAYFDAAYSASDEKVLAAWEHYREELVQVAATAVAMLEDLELHGLPIGKQVVGLIP